MKPNVFIFGEAEKGDFCTPILLESLEQTLGILGHPPKGSVGVDYAVRTILFEQQPIFYRVHEEGFCQTDYLRGVKLLYNELEEIDIAAICIPGMGDPTVIDPLTPVCMKRGSILIVQESDLYDYLTASKY